MNEFKRHCVNNVMFQHDIYMSVSNLNISKFEKEFDEKTNKTSFFNTKKSNIKKKKDFCDRDRRSDCKNSKKINQFTISTLRCSILILFFFIDSDHTILFS